MKSSAKYSVIDQVAFAFWEGDFESIQKLKCSVCGSNFSFSAYKEKHDLKAEPGRRFKFGLNISCAFCDLRLAHYDGYCPAWLENEEVEDWDKFSELLYHL